MKHLRVFILVLLAVLLPIRGVMAATMLCPEGVGSNLTLIAPVHKQNDMHTGHDMHSDHSAAHHHSSTDASDDSSSSGEHPANCHFCASGCCMPSMVATVPCLGLPGPISSVRFPALTAPLPAFHSDGQDRPPRTI